MVWMNGVSPPKPWPIGAVGGQDFPHQPFPWVEGAERQPVFRFLDAPGAVLGPRALGVPVPDRLDAIAGDTEVAVGCDLHEVEVVGVLEFQRGAGQLAAVLVVHRPVAPQGDGRAVHRRPGTGPPRDVRVWSWVLS